MIKNFIVPIDFSSDSLKGLDLAVLFSTKTYVNIQMVYVQKMSSDISPSSEQEEKKSAIKKFDEIVKKYTPRLGYESKLRYIIKQGRVFEEVVEQAKSYSASMITASTHGASGFEEFFIGSNAFKIISAADKPVMTIRKNTCPKSFDKILIPINYNTVTRQKVPLSVEIAKLFNSELHLVTVATSKSKKMQARLNAYLLQVVKYLDQQGLNHHSHKLYGTNSAEITLDYARSINADLISIMTENGSSLGNLILGNTVQEMLNKSEVPLLCIHPREFNLKGTFSTFGG
jgi:nucleotide-binding universal stress UspA family protein